jgi:hypothetical protein
MSDTPVRLNLTLLPDRLAICRLAADDALPAWAATVRGFLSLTRTAEELSVVCAESAVPEHVKREAGWIAYQVAGPLDFALTGILAALAGPLADAGISLFAVSTFDTDYILVRASAAEAAGAALRAAGHTIAPA